LNLRIFKILVCLCFAAAPALAQGDDPPFWKQRGEITKDDAGRVTFAEERDPSTYTVRIFSKGVWTKHYYKPHTTQALKVETPDTVEEWLYDQHGNYSGMRIHFNGVVLELHSEGLGKRLSASGMPLISVEKDRGGRVSRIHDAKGTDLARFQFDEKGYLRNLEVGSRTLELSAPIDGKVQETLKADGRVVTATVAGSVPNPQFFPFCLDTVRQQLNLPDDWQNGLTFRRSATGTVTTALAADGKPLLYMIDHGGNRFGFDTAGKPLFIDIAIDLAYGTVEHEADTGPAINEQSAVAPNRIVIAPDGRVGVCTVGAAAGAIASFWTERMSNGATVTRYRTYGAGAPKTKSMAPQSQHRSGKSISSFQPAPNVYYYVCDSTTTCTIGPDWCECSSCTTTTYYCAADSGGGGGTSGGGTTGGGSGGGGNASNTITEDSTLRTKVDNAINTAASKLANCGSSLTSLKALNGQSLGTMLSGKAGGPWSMATFIQGGANGTGQVFKMDTASNPNGICAAGAPAYTNLYQNTTFICQQQFLGLTSSEQYVRIIHEELHTLGYPENPPTAWAQTPAQISAMVAQRCP
jgi:hypothetical protein